jgi:hypothetical protein
MTLSTRRQFCSAVLGGSAGGSAWSTCAIAEPERAQSKRVAIDVAEVEHDRVVRAADRYLREPPVTITARTSDRSAGGAHDYFSEGDYWWPDPAEPGGPYIRRDGMTNPDNFVSHREALIRFSVQACALTAAWQLTRNPAYAAHAAEHCRAWFLNPSTLMNPNLQYAQAIHGRSNGRGVGIIDTIHLVEVARALPFMRSPNVLSVAEHDRLQQWFRDYLRWLTTSNNGIEERDAKNNHGTCWVMQVAQFAQYTAQDELMKYCSERYKNVLVPNQIASDGSLPLELERTKPYSYCLFNLDALAAICQILTSPDDDLWSYSLSDGRSLRRAIAWMFPYIADKRRWPHPPDVEYFDQFPVRQPGLLFAGLAYSERRYLELWRRLNPEPAVAEVIRNYPLRQPVLWA